MASYRHMARTGGRQKDVGRRQEERKHRKTCKRDDGTRARTKQRETNQKGRKEGYEGGSKTKNNDNNEYPKTNSITLSTNNVTLP